MMLSIFEPQAQRLTEKIQNSSKSGA